MDPVSHKTLSLIHASTPHLRVLDISFLFETAGIKTQLAWGRALYRFTQLERLIVEPSGSADGKARHLSPADQGTLVKAWSNACPSLTVICFRPDSRWSEPATYMDEWSSWSLAVKRSWRYARVSVDKSW